MSMIPILSLMRNACIFFVCIFPISCCASFWDTLFGENPIEDTESIFEAIEKERLGNVERLLARGVLLEERNSEGLTPLLYAIQRLSWYFHKENIEKIILTLIEQGAFLESTDSQGNTPLLRCCAEYNKAFLPLVKILLERGADLEARNQQGETPLFRAAMNGRTDVLKILLERGANLEARNQRGETPLFKAAMNGRTDVLKVLIEKNANKEARNNAHQTALMVAAEENQVKAVDELLRAGTTVDSRDENEMTPLMYASYKGHLAIIQILLQYNADIGSRSTRDVLILQKNNQDLSFFSDLYRSQTVIPAGSTALTFAEKCGGRGAEKILIEAWVKRDPTMEKVLVEWRKKVTEF
jgi:ankyrin repeat protein